MPTYEYECQDCGIHFDRRQRITEEALKTCPECGGLVKRVLHPVGVVFKGSGWYVTDHRRPQPVGESEPSSKKKESTSTSESSTATSDSPSTTTPKPASPKADSE
ncbi:MAG: zinc ribbon domain-containing protein [Chloroflexi bacterium]|nr:zinc ribbon domain-containing protein [Chloroflexota bacterium]MBU1747490.1 zinc ribbon domain-containing protein [Chloroflexota bacterium]MBU1879403.1 zinc ribbon domain-containing protein [Chloroflexota bacterium]